MAPSQPADLPRALDQARRGPRVKPADERRRDILAAACVLFHDRGYAATTVQAIAAAAGVAAGTVYLHFPSKEAVLSALQEDFEAGLLDRFAEVAAGVVAHEVATGRTVSHREVIDQLVDGMMAYSLERRTAAHVVARHSAHAAATATARAPWSDLNDLLARVIREGVRLGHVHAQDPDTTAYLLNVAGITAIAHALLHDDSGELDRVVRALKELCVKALAPTPPEGS